MNLSKSVSLTGRAVSATLHSICIGKVSTVWEKVSDNFKNYFFASAFVLLWEFVTDDEVKLVRIWHFCLCYAYLSNYVIFIGPKSDHWECLSLTHSLTNYLLSSNLDWCDPGMWRWQLKLVEVIRVAHVDDKKRLCFVEMLIFGWDFEVGAWSRFWRWLIKTCVRTCDIWLKVVTLVSRTQPSGPLCL